MLTRVDHLVVAVTDLERATETYGRLLGLAPSWRGVHPGMGTANTLFRLSNTYVELLAAEGDTAFSDFLRDHVEHSGEGPLAIAFGTEDAEAAATALRARGIAVPDPEPGSGRDAASGALREWKNFVLPPAASRGVPLIVIEHVSPLDTLPIAKPLAAGAVNAVDHVVIMTGDADGVIALYGEALGVRLAFDKTFVERGLRLIFFRVGGLTLECAVPLGDQAVAPGSDRFWGISYRVDDVVAARARLARSGFDVSEVRKGHKAGTAVCTVRSETHGVATLVIGSEDHDRTP